jgi:mRNA-degrading endonuclease RelE of RelBE toxin-antitoxin system
VRFRIRYSETFDAKWQKHVPEDIRPQVRMYLEARLSKSPREGSVLWPPSSKELRTDSIYAGPKVGYLRILFEIMDDEVTIWSVSRGRLPDV